MSPAYPMRQRLAPPTDIRPCRRQAGTVSLRLMRWQAGTVSGFCVLTCLRVGRFKEEKDEQFKTDKLIIRQLQSEARLRASELEAQLLEAQNLAAARGKQITALEGSVARLNGLDDTATPEAFGNTASLFATAPSASSGGAGAQLEITPIGEVYVPAPHLLGHASRGCLVMLPSTLGKPPARAAPVVSSPLLPPALHQSASPTPCACVVLSLILRSVGGDFGGHWGPSDSLGEEARHLVQVMSLKTLELVAASANVVCAGDEPQTARASNECNNACRCFCGCRHD